MADCVACHKPNPDHAKFCQFCGVGQSAVPATAAHGELADPACPACGKPNPVKRKFCAGCGCKLEAVSSPAAPVPDVGDDAAIKAEPAVADATLSVPPADAEPLPAAVPAIVADSLPAVDTDADAEQALVEENAPIELEALPIAVPQTEREVVPAVADVAAAVRSESDGNTVPTYREPASAAQVKADDVPVASPVVAPPGTRKWLYLLVAVVCGVLVAVAGVLLSNRVQPAAESKSKVASAPAVQATQTLAPGTHIVDSKNAPAAEPLPPLKPASAPQVAPAMPPEPVEASAKPAKPLKAEAPAAAPAMPAEPADVDNKPAHSKVAKKAQGSTSGKADNSVDALRRKKEELLKELRQSN